MENGLCVCLCVLGGACTCCCLRDDRFLCGTQAHTNTLACTVQIHTWLRLYTHGGCVVMRLLHDNYTLKRRVYVHGRVLSSDGGLLRRRSRGSFTVAGKSERRKDRSISEGWVQLFLLLLFYHFRFSLWNNRCLAAMLIIILIVNRSSLSSRKKSTSNNVPKQLAQKQTGQRKKINSTDPRRYKKVCFSVVFFVLFLSSPLWRWLEREQFNAASQECEDV